LLRLPFAYLLSVFVISLSARAGAWLLLSSTALAPGAFSSSYTIMLLCCGWVLQTRNAHQIDHSHYTNSHPSA
jgi:hypothetical protein